MRERWTITFPAGVNSVSVTAFDPCALSTMPVETPMNWPVSESASAPTHRPARDMCSKPEPSGNSNDAEREPKLFPKNA